MATWNGSNKPCDDATFAARLKTFGRSVHPFIFTPGDNDWTDCGKASMGGFDPLERLAKVRALFFPAPGRTLGKRPLPADALRDAARGRAEQQRRQTR